MIIIQQSESNTNHVGERAEELIVENANIGDCGLFLCLCII